MLIVAFSEALRRFAPPLYAGLRIRRLCSCALAAETAVAFVQEGTDVLREGVDLFEQGGKEMFFASTGTLISPEFEQSQVVIDESLRHRLLFFSGEIIEAEMRHKEDRDVFPAGLVQFFGGAKAGIC
ncbi:MAG: hypothetical protein MZV70_44370 [Desulfobacterales bacterium]|nr:hypothetical protein [Desulfobacterales bacterium]